MTRVVSRKDIDENDSDKIKLIYIRVQHRLLTEDLMAWYLTRVIFQ